MDLGDFIKLGAEPLPLPFLVIGGHAVGAHGHTRATFDVDFLVRRLDHDNWLARTAGAGLKRFAETSSFAQFSSPEPGDELDLMFVNQDTFDEMWQASKEFDFGGQRARVPSLNHLLALKLHVLKQSLPHRTGKDAEDVEMLLRRNKIDLSTPPYEQLFLKYGSRELYDAFTRILRHQ